MDDDARRRLAQLKLAVLQQKLEQQRQIEAQQQQAAQWYQEMQMRSWQEQQMQVMQQHLAAQQMQIQQNESFQSRIKEQIQKAQEDERFESLARSFQSRPVLPAIRAPNLNSLHSHTPVERESPAKHSPSSSHMRPEQSHAQRMDEQLMKAIILQTISSQTAQLSAAVTAKQMAQAAKMRPRVRTPPRQQTPPPRVPSLRLKSSRKASVVPSQRASTAASTATSASNLDSRASRMGEQQSFAPKAYTGYDEVEVVEPEPLPTAVREYNFVDEDDVLPELVKMKQEVTKCRIRVAGWLPMNHDMTARTRCRVAWIAIRFIAVLKFLHEKNTQLRDDMTDALERQHMKVHDDCVKWLVEVITVPLARLYHEIHDVMDGQHLKVFRNRLVDVFTACFAANSAERGVPESLLRLIRKYATAPTFFPDDYLLPSEEDAMYWDAFGGTENVTMDHVQRLVINFLVVRVLPDILLHAEKWGFPARLDGCTAIAPVTTMMVRVARIAAVFPRTNVPPLEGPWKTELVSDRVIDLSVVRLAQAVDEMRAGLIQWVQALITLSGAHLVIAYRQQELDASDSKQHLAITRGTGYSYSDATWLAERAVSARTLSRRPTPKVMNDVALSRIVTPREEITPPLEEENQNDDFASADEEEEQKQEEKEEEEKEEEEKEEEQKEAEEERKSSAASHRSKKSFQSTHSSRKDA
jgi:hypothetical protein